MALLEQSYLQILSQMQINLSWCLNWLSEAGYKSSLVKRVWEVSKNGILPFESCSEFGWNQLPPCFLFFLKSSLKYGGSAEVGLSVLCSNHPVSLGESQQLIHGFEMLLFKFKVCSFVYLVSKFKSNGQLVRGVKWQSRLLFLCLWKTSKEIRQN